MDEIINQQTDTIQSPPIQQEKPIKNKPSIWILFTIIFFITTLILSYLLLNQKQEIDDKEQELSGDINSLAKTTPSPLYSQTDVVADEEIYSDSYYEESSKALIFPSLDNKYYYYFYQSENYGWETKQKCLYEIRDKEKNLIDISNLTSLNKVNCTGSVENYYYTDESFYGWKDNGKLLLKTKNGEIAIIDIENLKLQFYNYDSNNLVFINANRSLEYWLFKKIKKENENKESYVLLDKNKKVILDNINYEEETSAKHDILYDIVNDGYLFITEEFNNDIIKFKYFSTSTLTTKNILIAKISHTNEEGIGCSPSRIIPRKKGEMLLDLGCYDYLGEIIFGEKCLSETKQGEFCIKL